MKQSKLISKAVIKRLPRYRRYLGELKKKGVEKISSKDLSELIGYTASQIRQDLNNFGGFGQQGYGYSVKQLKEEIKGILGLNNRYQAILIGAGNFGSALANHLDFQKLGFELVACFDGDPAKKGQLLGELTIRSESDLEEFCGNNRVDTAILCIPKDAVEAELDRLYSLGIRSFWNFSHYDISRRYSDAIVENVHLSDMLMTLCYKMNNLNS